MMNLKALTQILLAQTGWFVPIRTYSATLFTQLQVEGARITDDVNRVNENGWLTTAGNQYAFRVGYKQAERNSANPFKVATISVSDHEHFSSSHAIALTIGPHHEQNPKSTAYYKVSLSSAKHNDAFLPAVDKAVPTFHGFAMKIDASYFKVDDGANVMLEEFWQGSPFHPPVSIWAVSPAESSRRGWAGQSSFGHFALMLADDDHAPLGNANQALMYDLGPIAAGQWMRWVVEVEPSPSKPAGHVTVTIDGKQRLRLKNIKVGFDPNNPKYGQHRPSSNMDAIDVLLYRKNGDSYQRAFFDDVRLADTFAGAEPKASE